MNNKGGCPESIAEQLDFQDAVGFWQHFLHHVTAPTSLKMGQFGSRSRSDQEQAISYRLSAGLTVHLQSLARSVSVELSTLLQAVWAIVLYRYTAEKNLLFGIWDVSDPITPFCVQIPPELSLLSWLPQLQAQRDQIRTYSDLPLDQIHQLSEFASEIPLFESLLITATAANPIAPLLHCELAAVVAVASDELEWTIHYDPACYQAETIKRLLGHIHTLLSGVIETPDCAMAKLPLLTATEREQLLVEWNNTQTEFPNDQCIHQLFEAQVERTPDAIAVQFGDQSLTYCELNTRANQLAYQLQAIGVKPDVLVGICIERSLDMIVAVLGILKAGGAYVPLDPTHPKDRLAFLMQDAQVAVLLTQTLIKVNLPETSAQIVCLDQDWAAQIANLIPDLTQPPLSGVTPNNLAYIIYTSGSTGKPKGVAMSHSPLVNLLFWQINQSVVNQSARTLQFTSISFDVSFQEIFSTWSAGGTLVLIADEVRRDNQQLFNFLVKESIERLFLPFVALQNLAGVASSQNIQPTRLCEIITAGEQLQISRQIVNWFTQLPSCVLHNHYGPSETHVVTAYTLTGNPRHWPMLPPIGCPISNAQTYILDAGLQPVPIGAVGELYLGGVSLANGYLNRPELTAEKFIVDPFNLNPTGRFYRTGDLARYSPDGNIEYLGRADSQVKIQGYRIELGEIETALAYSPFVQEAVVIVREDIPGDKRLVAYVALESGKALTTSALRHFLKQTLPDYMVPANFVFLKTLPLTPSGKVDRRALLMQPLALTRPELEESYVSPRNSIEQQLANIWSQVLQIDRVGINDNFFDLGGTSFLGAQVIEQIQLQLDTEIRAVKLYQYSTVCLLADHLSSSFNHQESRQQAIDTLQARAQRQKAAQFQRQRPAKRG